MAVVWRQLAVVGDNSIRTTDGSQSKDFEDIRPHEEDRRGEEGRRARRALYKVGRSPLPSFLDIPSFLPSFLDISSFLP